MARTSIRRRRRRGTVTFVIIGIALTFVFFAPLVLSIFRSLQPSTDLVQAPENWDWGALTFSNYIDLFVELNFFMFVGNSLIAAVGASLFTAVLATLAGFGLGRFRFRGSRLVFGVLLVALMVPFQALLTPIYLQFDAIGLVDNLFGLVLFYGTFSLPFGVFVMMNTFATMPPELEEAAQLDGLTVLGTLWRILRPLALPGIATTIIFTFLNAWVEFLGAFTFITSEEKLTLPVALLYITQGTYGQVNFGYVVAGSVVSMVPCVALYIALQRYYVQGLASGAVRG